MANCVVCHSPKVSTFWSGQGADALICSFTCSVTKNPNLHLAFGIIFSIVSIPFAFNNNIAHLFLSLIIFLPLALIFLYGYYVATTNKERLAKLKKSRMETEEKLRKTDSYSMIFVEGLNKKVPSCCYQTARLGESYCVCGRAVDQELIKFQASNY